VFERVVSKTRPSFLPPKSRDEDQKHMADWEKMMKRSRAAGTPQPTYPKKSILRDLREKRKNEEKHYKTVGLQESFKLSSRYIYGRRRSYRTGK
jgi:hypothetical protein